MRHHVLAVAAVGERVGHRHPRGAVSPAFDPREALERYTELRRVIAGRALRCEDHRRAAIAHLTAVVLPQDAGDTRVLRVVLAERARAEGPSARLRVRVAPRVREVTARDRREVSLRETIAARILVAEIAEELWPGKRDPLYVARRPRG